MDYVRFACQTIIFKMTWEMIDEMRIKASEAGDTVAMMISSLDLNSNAMTLSLGDPYDAEAPTKQVRSKQQ